MPVTSIVAGRGGLDGAGPADGEGFGVELGGVGRGGVPVEVDLLVGAGEGGCAGEGIVVEVFGLEAFDVGAGCGAELRAGDDDRRVFGVGRALRVEDFCVRETV